MIINELSIKTQTDDNNNDSKKSKQKIGGNFNCAWENAFTESESFSSNNIFNCI